MQAEWAIARAEDAARIVMHVSRDFGAGAVCGDAQAEHLVSIGAYGRIGEALLCRRCLELVRKGNLEPAS